MAKAALHAPVDIVEVVSEAGDPGDDPPELTPAIDDAPLGEVRVQLRRTTSRVTVGTGLARRPELLAAVRALPQAPLVTTTSAGGTFVVGGPGWLALSAVGRPPPGQVLPLDWMLAALRGWLSAALAAAGLPELTAGAVEGAWCSGFSDLQAGGRKVVGLGFRVTRERVLARGTIAVASISPADMALLQGCHALIGREVRREACSSLVELAAEVGVPGTWDVETAIRLLGGGDR